MLRAVRRALAVGTIATSLALVGGLVAAPADAVTKRYKEYVALGDSWSADVVIFDANGLPDSTYAPVDCAQSHVNYPKLVAKALAIPTFRDATCGSATTQHFAKPQTGLPLGGTNAPQYDRLTKSTDLVTIGIGGNDAGFAGAAIECLSALPVALPLPIPLALPFSIPFLGSSLPLGGCRAKYTAGGVDRLAQAIADSKPKLVAAIKAVKKRSPNARILMVNYLAGIPQHACYPIVPIREEDMTYLYATFQKLNAMVAGAAKQGGVELVNTYTPSVGHDVCALPTQRYVEGLGVVSVNGLAVAVPAHPNSAGATAQAKYVLNKIRN